MFCKFVVSVSVKQDYQTLAAHNLKSCLLDRRFWVGHAGLSASFFGTCGCLDGGETAGLHILAGFALLVQHSLSAKPA